MRGPCTCNCMNILAQTLYILNISRVHGAIKEKNFKLHEGALYMTLDVKSRLQSLFYEFLHHTRRHQFHCERERIYLLKYTN